MIQVPAKLPMVDQDIEVMCCTVCGAIVPGVWQQCTRREMQAGIDHVLDRHAADLVAGRLRPPLFVNCAIQDPFWFEEHA